MPGPLGMFARSLCDQARFVGGLSVGSQAVSAELAGAEDSAADAAPPTPSLPRLASRSGDLFVDTLDSGLHWYLPAWALAPDVDPAFAFTASQTGQQANGQPFDTASLSFRLVPVQPDDVQAFVAANPGARLQAIPLVDVNVTLSSAYTDGAGQTQHRTFPGTQQPQADGSLLVTFADAVLGDAVPALFQDLKVFGNAALAVTATFSVESARWVPRVIPLDPANQPAFPGEIRQSPGSGNRLMVLNRAALARSMSTAADNPAAAPAQGLAVQRQVYHPLDSGSIAKLWAGWHVSRPVFGSWVDFTTAQPWTQSIALGLTFAAAAYQFRYTVSMLGQPPATLTDVAQLNSFNSPQTQYVELDMLGDLSATYPSIARAFVGRLTPQIVVIPQRYAIVRSKSGLSATCLARVDPSATGIDDNIFEFTFVVAPHVSRIDVQAFGIALQAHPEFRDHPITFANTLSATPSVLQTSFGDSAVFTMGPTPHTFAVTLPVRGSSATPAVADANLVLHRLSSGTGADLIGTLNLSVDPGTPDPIAASLDLNVLRTVGTDDLIATIDPATGAMTLANASPFDIAVGGCSVESGSTLTALPAPGLIPAGGSAALAWPPGVTADPSAQILADGELSLALPAAATDVIRLINFVTVDVSATQLFVAIDASQVDFDAIASLTVTILFQSTGAAPPVTLILNKPAPIGTTTVQVPIQDVVYSLPVSVQVIVTSSVAGTLPIGFVLQNDFNASPTVTIHQADIDTATAA